MPTTTLLSPIRIPELALQRYARRYDSSFCSAHGRYFLLRLTQQLFDILQSELGNAEVTVWGSREVGGTVVFDLGSAVDVERADAPEEAAEFARIGRQLLEEISDRCMCGRHPAVCDCCSVCE